LKEPFQSSLLLQQAHPTPTGHFSYHCCPNFLSKSVAVGCLSTGSLGLPTTHRLMGTQVAEAEKKMFSAFFSNEKIVVST